MCRWPHCNLPTSDGSTLMCRHHAAHVDACMARLIDPLTAAAVERNRPESQPYTTRLQRRYP